MKQILVLEHMPSQNPGIFRELAAARGVAFTEVDLHAGETSPDPAGFDGLWVMGGSMNVWDEAEYPWLRAEKELIREAVVERGLPFFGICLGHQLLADALGGAVRATEDFEIGVHDVTPTAAGVEHALLARLPRPTRWVNVHRAEVSRAPAEATILAQSELCANHAMQVGDAAYSVQFHPEVCEHTVAAWLQIPGIPEALVSLLGPGGVEDFSREVEAQRMQHNRAAARLFDNWLDLVY
ncbi:MAG: type 1 glutamine amidotransferase [Gammaproteobacteria bacterium]|nr:type 1 glutamine amidotransferase [Gammaproteobacteria bacterium]